MMYSAKSLSRWRRCMSPAQLSNSAVVNRSLKLVAHRLVPQRHAFTENFLPSFASILNDTHVNHVKEEREMLNELLKILHAMEATPEEIELIADTRSRIDDLFMQSPGRNVRLQLQFVRHLSNGSFKKQVKPCNIAVLNC